MSVKESERRVYFLVGAFLLLGICAVLYLALRIGGGMAAGTGSYELKARFSDVGGLNPGSPVLISGVKIGTVGKIDLDVEDFSAIVELILPDRVQLDDDTIASVRSKGLLGENHVSLSPGGSGFPLNPGDMIIDTEPAVGIADLIGKMAFGGIEEEPDAFE